MSLDSLLGQDSITVSGPVTTQDASGGFSQRPFTQLYTNVAARVEDASASQRFQYMQLQQVVTHTVYTRQTGIQNGHIITTSEGLVLRVQGVKKNRGIGSMTDFYDIACEEVKNP